MASLSSRRREIGAEGAASGAAEEPEPEPGPPSSTAPASYDPRDDYQPPHPDDRDGNDGNPAKKGGKDKGGARRCGNCDAADAKSKCKGCGVERYCGKECQAEHWKYGGHKSACPAYVLAAAAHSQQLRLCELAFEADQCLICLEPPREPTTLPCGHAFCTACVVELRAKGVSKTCPLCRAPLPPGPKKLYELAVAVWVKIARAVGTGKEWPALSASQQREMDGAIVMAQEAMDHGHVEAADLIGSIYFWGQGVAVDYARAIAAYKVAAEGGYVVSQYQVGMVYYRGCSVDVDYEQAIPWFEKAAAQDMPEALTALGGIYYNGQGMPPSFRHAREYWKRAIELGNSLAVENMRVLTKAIPKHAPLMGKRVEIHGTSRADLNGKGGVAPDLHMMGGPKGDRATWRYTVKLDGGEAFKLKRANVRAEGAGGASGGAGAGAGAGAGKQRARERRGVAGANKGNTASWQCGP